MRKWLRLFSPVSLPPTNIKEFIPWLVLKLIYWLIGPIGLLILVGALILVTFFAFMIGNYNSSPQGQFNASTSTVTLAPKQQVLNVNINYNATKVANTWEKGLAIDEVQAVNQANLEVPSGLLLSIGKVEDNLKSSTVSTFQNYYRYMQPVQFRFIHKTNMTITYDHVWVPKHCHTIPGGKGKPPVHDCTPAHWECDVNETDTPVTLITYANTWNGTYSATYHDVITGSKGCPGGSGSRTWSSKWVLQTSQRSYSWSKIWNLFQHIKTVNGWFTDNQMNTDLLAGLIAAKDPSINDPTVQNMVSQMTMISGVSALGNIGNFIVPSSPDVIKNVASYAPYIQYFANAYQIPPVLLAAQMAQESGGVQIASNGQVTMSSAGAMGLMQVLPTTAQGLTILLPNGQTQYVGNHWYSLLKNPIINISIGADYISNLYKEFGDNITEALAAYNAGPGAEQTALAGINAVQVNGVNIPNYSQTIGYVNDIENGWMTQLSSFSSS